MTCLGLQWPGVSAISVKATSDGSSRVVPLSDDDRQMTSALFGAISNQFAIASLALVRNQFVTRPGTVNRSIALSLDPPTDHVKPHAQPEAASNATQAA